MDAHRFRSFRIILNEQRVDDGDVFRGAGDEPAFTLFPGHEADPLVLVIDFPDGLIQIAVTVGGDDELVQVAVGLELRFLAGLFGMLLDLLDTDQGLLVDQRTVLQDDEGLDE